MKPIFRNSMFGFNKEDVASFIAKQSNHFEKKISDLETKLENTQNSFELERKSLISDRKELEDLRKLKADFSSEVALLISLSGNVEKDNELISSSCDHNKSVVLNFEGAVNELNLRIKKAEEFKEKAGRFDQLATVLGEIFAGKSTKTPVENASGSLDFDSIDLNEILNALDEQKKLIEQLVLDYSKLSEQIIKLKEKV